MWYAMKFVQRCPGHCWSVNEAIYSNMANSYRAKHKLFVRVVYILLVYRAIIISGAVPDTALGNERNFRRRGQTFQTRKNAQTVSASARISNNKLRYVSPCIRDPNSLIKIFVSTCRHCCLSLKLKRDMFYVHLTRAKLGKTKS